MFVPSDEALELIGVVVSEDVSVVKVKLSDECDKDLDDASLEMMKASGSVSVVANVEDELENSGNEAVSEDTDGLFVPSDETLKLTGSIVSEDVSVVKVTLSEESDKDLDDASLEIMNVSGSVSVVAKVEDKPAREFKTDIELEDIDETFVSFDDELELRESV